ncbi:unnamed protein product [Cuscuta epithymum]|uniref:Uncharacterized protein n=1 Tax=Cuscuta epithymum TaxID=186058 RepID=A0AAV0D929_9ASTE|nr:unnamed protein product [Cuscuta epithymum]
MYGRELQGGELCERGWFSQHMPATVRRIVAAGDSCLTSVTADSFCKDGRKISVGDCALFKPPHDYPPFIGIIRRVTPRNENSVELSVNWLYRPAELNLGKGLFLDAAPNEIFYSFHSDEIPAASLLHPCKVAFLPKVVELPTGISSFICRRVYDIENKCLWWLTDQDYINERQEEVNQLLHKTRLEMHASLQPGSRSPKPTIVPMSTSHSKPGSDNMQSNVTSFSAQVKGKKRERGDQGSDQIKRERSSKIDDSDSGLYKTESVLKSEISKVTERGGLVDFEGVEKLIQLMQPERVERKMDLTNRSILAGVVAATDKFDCLNRFVQLRGLLVLDEWLQDVHKGRVGDGNQKDGDQYVEEFLLVLLRALDKLPVNLQALQMCNIGKSVNHLRSHKNMDIQKKARSLVDTWKKRVEAEMNMIDSKTGSGQAVAWPSKSRLSEAPHVVNKIPGGSNELTGKSSVSLLAASKTAPLKPLQGEPILKSASSSPRPLRSASYPAPGKDSHAKVSISGAPDFSREDKSTSPNQPHNHGQSLSGKEDARNYTLVSLSNSKISNSSSRQRKAINGLPGTPIFSGQKESAIVRCTSLQKNSFPEKVSQSAVPGEKAVDVPVTEGSSNKLVVKIPNRGRSPTHTASVGSYEEHSNMNSRASSPVVSEKYDQCDQNAKENNDAYRSIDASDVNEESWHSNDLKDILTGSDDGEVSPAVLPDEGLSKIADDGKPMEALKVTTSSSEADLASKLHEASFSSMNALVESCAKHSEAHASISIGDAVGMNLLASVATEEMSKSDRHSPSALKSPLPNETCMPDDSRCKPSHFENIRSAGIRRNDNLDDFGEKKVVDVRNSWSVEKIRPTVIAVSEASGDKKPDVSPEGNATGDKHNGYLCNDLKVAAVPHVEKNERSIERENSFSSPGGAGQTNNGGHKKSQVRHAIPSGGSLLDDVHDAKLHDNETPMLDDNLCNAPSSTDDHKRLGEALSSDLSLEADMKNNVTAALELNPCVEAVSCEVIEKHEKEVLPPCSSRAPLVNKIYQAEDAKGDDVYQSERQISDKGGDNLVPDAKSLVDNGSALITDSKDCKEVNVETRKVWLRHPDGSLSKKEIAGFSCLELEKHVDPKEIKPCGVFSDNARDPVPTTIMETCSVAALSPSSKMKFDLNVSDDGKYGEVGSAAVHGCSSALHVMNPLPSLVTSMPNSVPASITVAAAAKGPFVPPEELLLRFKGVIGWKGSAATSAFRPAEPRKVLDMPTSSVAVSHSEGSSDKHARPLFDFDLNVPDERVIEEIQDSAAAIGSTSNHASLYAFRNEPSGSSPSVRSSGGLDLDLNKADDPNDVGQSSLSSSLHRFEGLTKPLQSGASMEEGRRDFDLNNGPGTDDANGEQSLFLENVRGRINSQQAAASSLRMNNQEIGNFSSWVPQGSPYSLLPDRGEQPFQMLPLGAQRILGHAAAGTPFAPDVYRGSVLSSSPALHFQSASFPYSMFPFGTTFPSQSPAYSVGPNPYIESTSGGRPFAPLVNSQLMGHVQSQFPRPYMVGLPDGVHSGSADNNRKWARQGLDLNAGPGAVDTEGAEDSIPSRQLSILGSQAALTEENSRLYPIPGGYLKRKEPDGGWDNDSFRYKPASWQ